jgi:hypothetical protein
MAAILEEGGFEVEIEPWGGRSRNAEKMAWRTRR